MYMVVFPAVFFSLMLHFHLDYTPVEMINGNYAIESAKM